MSHLHKTIGYLPSRRLRGEVPQAEGGKERLLFTEFLQLCCNPP
ncbi:hypothetical protein [Rodentibacter trehalosifermentans]|nr:hypothetical protein [Rodentibacter trehalosifermentans]